MPIPVLDGKRVFGHVEPGDKMRLLEFFNPKHENWEQRDEDQDLVPKDDNLEDSIYYFIIDDDQLHKKHFLPLAIDYYKQSDGDNFDKKSFAKSCLPMVKDGCVAYCKSLKSEEEVPHEKINKELFKSLAHRLVDQIVNDVKEDAYGFKDLFT